MTALFQTDPLTPAQFVRRLNRFVVTVRVDGVEAPAHLPNPGRLGEILLPGMTLLVERRAGSGLPWKAVGATWTSRWPGDAPRTVYLDTAGANRLANRLIDDGLIPELRRYRIERAEVAEGRSRFDFLLRSARGRYLLEVKSVTLVEQGLALFPDARTERGRRHLLDLARCAADSGCRAGVLFLVQGPARRFLPDVHNDLEFARTFQEVRGLVDLLPYCIHPMLGHDGRLACVGPPERLSIPWRSIEDGVQDAGLYLLVLHVPQEVRVEVGSLGLRTFPAGFYVYTGSARRGLGRRIARHLRRRKRPHWHIDVLRACSAAGQAFAIRGAAGECELAAEVAGIGGTIEARFGASDCWCPGHLAWFPEAPFSTPAFQALLTRWRHSAA